MEAWLLAEGSTRPAGLLRIALALLVWACWGSLFAAYSVKEPWRLGAALCFWPSSTLMLLGWRSQWMALWCGATLMFVYHYGGLVIGNADGWLHHHQYLLASAVLLSSFTPCGGSFSIDRWRSGAPERGPRWGMSLIGFQLCCVYFWGAYDKVSWAWLSGARLEQIFRFFYFGSMPIPANASTAIAIATCLSIGLEFALAFGLFVPKARRVLLPMGLLMHAVFYLVLSVSTFSLTCIVMYLAFLDPDDVHDAIDRLLGRQPTGSIDTRASL